MRDLSAISPGDDDFKFRWIEVIADKELTSSQQLVCFAMAHYANTDGSEIWPGHDGLAKMCRYKNARQLTKPIDYLCSIGIIEPVGHYARGKAQEYRLVPPSAWEETATRYHERNKVTADLSNVLLLPTPTTPVLKVHENLVYAPPISQQTREQFEKQNAWENIDVNGQQIEGRARKRFRS